MIFSLYKTLIPYDKILRIARHLYWCAERSSLTCIQDARTGAVSVSKGSAV